MVDMVAMEDMVTKDSVEVGSTISITILTMIHPTTMTEIHSTIHLIDKLTTISI